MRYTFSRKIRYFPDAGCIRSQLVFVYDTRSEQVRRAVDLFDQGEGEDLWKRALKAGERAKDRRKKPSCEQGQA